MLADEGEVSKLVEIWREKCAGKLIAGAGVAHVDVEVGERLIGAHGDEIRNVKAGGLQEIDFAADIEVDQALERTVRSDNAGGNGSILAVVAKFSPIFVAAPFGFAHWNGQGIPAGCGIF